MKGYEEYKKTTYDWLPSVPAHWEWLYLSQVSKEQCRKNVNNTEKNILSLSYGSIIRKKNVDFGLSPKDYATYQIVSDGNIILRLTDLQNDKKSLRTGLVKERGIITSAYVCLVTQHNSNFLHYLLHSYDSVKLFYGLGGGVRQSIGFKDIRGLQIPLPPREEQDQIVRYLDAKVSKINKLIRIKQQQIALLKEKKQAIINQAVTKGLDPNAPMKDSGIAWIGQIPEGWEVIPLKKIATVQSGITLGKSYPANVVQNYPYMCVANVQNGFLDLSKVKNIQVPEHEALRHMLQKNDVLMTEGGDPDKLGRGCLWSGELEPCLHQNHIFAVRADSTQISSEYLCLFLSSSLSQHYFFLTSKQTTNLASTNKTKLGSLPIPLPSIEEQVNILAQFHAELRRHEALMDVCVSKIENLTGYRTRLISDVVTGKVDVRRINVPDSLSVDIEEDFTTEEAVDGDDADTLECEE